MEKPWLNLNPNDFSSFWWNKTDIIDVESAKIKKSSDDVICYFIIQDCHSLGFLFWRLSVWYQNDKNRYCSIIYDYEWIFNKKLEEIIDEEIVYLIENPNIKFKVNDCIFVKDDQKKYCKIFERIH